MAVQTGNKKTNPNEKEYFISHLHWLRRMFALFQFFRQKYTPKTHAQGTNGRIQKKKSTVAASTKGKMEDSQLRVKGRLFFTTVPYSIVWIYQVLPALLSEKRKNFLKKPRHSTTHSQPDEPILRRLVLVILEPKATRSTSVTKFSLRKEFHSTEDQCGIRSSLKNKTSFPHERKLTFPEILYPLIYHTK